MNADSGCCFVTQRIHRDLLLTFTCAFVVRSECVWMRGAERAREGREDIFLWGGSVWCVGQTLLLQRLPFVHPDMNAVYGRGVSANIDLSVAALRHRQIQPPAFLSSHWLLFIMLFDMETTVQI